MKKNQSRQGSWQKGRQSKGSKRKKKEDSRLVGFRTLQQVAGGPKPHAFHSRIPIMPVPTVREPNDQCSICGKTIENISQGMYTPSGQLAHFECVLSALKEANCLSEGQTLSYCGKGAFGIWEKDAEGKWTLVRKIPYEDAESYERMKAYVKENMA